MLVSDKFVFICTPKTGSTSTRKLLNELFSCKKLFGGTEFGYMSDMLDEYKDRLIFGNVRNPWAYYVSLYHYNKKKNGVWYNAFSGAKGFATWLRNMMDYKGGASQKVLDKVPGRYGKHSLTHGFKLADRYIGEYSYRYIGKYFNDADRILLECNIPYEKLVEDHDKLIGLNAVCSVEDLYVDIARLFNNNDIKISLKKLAKHMKRAFNKSKHRPYMTYYSKDLIKLVKTKDSLIINRYRYAPK